jgi:hypothetical protein
MLLASGWLALLVWFGMRIKCCLPFAWAQGKGKHNFYVFYLCGLTSVTSATTQFEAFLLKNKQQLWRVSTPHACVAALKCDLWWECLIMYLMGQQ